MLDPRQTKISQLKVSFNFLKFNKAEIDSCKTKQSTYDNKLNELQNVLKALKVYYCLWDSLIGKYSCYF